MLLVPPIMFFLLWPNWGTTLYGEVRGASDFKRVFAGMFFGLWLTVALTIIFFLVMAKTVGWGFYQNLNSLDYNLGTPQFGILPYPFMFAGWLVNNTAFQVVLILVLQPVVLRLGGNPVPVLDPGHLRGRVRPRAPRPGG